jgi:hypothetical protein
MFEFTMDRANGPTPAAVYPGHWRLISLTFAFSIFMWMVAIAVNLRVGRRGSRGLH